jgi:hypothetical protein
VAALFKSFGHVHVSPTKQLLTSTTAIRQAVQLLIDGWYLLKSLNSCQPSHAIEKAHWDKSLSLFRSAAKTPRTASTLHEDEETIGR